MRICLAGDTGIEPMLRESKSRVLPLHQSPTESRIVKEHFSTMAIKQKTLWIFISEGLVSKLLVSVYVLAKPPESSIALYPNDVREHVQPLNSGRCFCMDIFLKFMIEFYYTFGYLSSTFWITLQLVRFFRQ